MSTSVELVLLVGVGIVAGFLNVTAGGGTLLTLPVLIFLGLPAAVANGTNRIAILVQNIFATARFRHFDVIPKGVTFITAAPAVAGSIVGAHLAVNIDELLFKRILAVIMIFALGFMLLARNKAVPTGEQKMNLRKKIYLAISFLGIGMYGGFIQAGIGFLIIITVTAAGYDLVRTNALKVLVVLIFTPIVLLIFIINGQVDFLKGSFLAAGNAIGAWIATRVVVERGHQFIRWIVIVTVIGFAAKLFFG